MIHDFEARAAELLDAGAHGYFAGGAGDEVTLRDNVAAWDRFALVPRVLVGVELGWSQRSGPHGTVTAAASTCR